MRHGLGLAGLLIASLLLIIGSPPRPARAQAAAQQATVPHQVLVMLKLAPPHFRPNRNYTGAYGDRSSASARRRIARGIARRNGLMVEGNWPMPLLGVDCFVMRVPDDRAVADAVTRLAADPQVLWAQPMQLYRTLGTESVDNDPLYRVQPTAGAWRLADLHRVATGRGVSVAVIDSRVEVGHPDLSGQFVADRDFVIGHPDGAEQHGTGIAGVIGAKANNGLGIAGVAPGARMLALRACWQAGGAANVPTVCDTLSLAKALHFAIEKGAQIINLSLSGPQDQLLSRLISIALSRQLFIVAAYDPALPRGGFPASQQGVIAVADQALPSRPIAVYGAPGRDVPTTQPGGTWYFVNGSSYAAAHVSGLLALVREERRAIATRTLSTSGRGAVDACATLLPVSLTCDCSCAVARVGSGVGRR